MSHDYKAVQWTPFKKIFDIFMLIGIAIFLILFVVFSFMSAPVGENIHPVQILIRATGSLAFMMLTLILLIGPLARITKRALPLLYNRRHVGVVTFIIGLLHFGLVAMWYHGFSETNFMVSILSSNPNYDRIQSFPFESLGLVALIILFIMAATSHDFWNANLGPNLWKALHMSVYLVYGLIVLHVMLGILQYEKAPIYSYLVLGSAGVVTMLHLLTGIRIFASKDFATDGWINLGDPNAIPDHQAMIVSPEQGDAIAVFRQGDKIGAIANACRHQNGPLGEGKIVDCLVTCPWHGFQYRLEDGQSPAPFNEMIATYNTKMQGFDLMLDPKPNPVGKARPLTLINLK